MSNDAESWIFWFKIGMGVGAILITVLFYYIIEKMLINFKFDCLRNE